MSYRFAIIGCGSIASRHAVQIRSIGRLVAVCDTDEAKVAGFSQTFGAKPYLSLTKMLDNEKPDLLVVCTPNGLHPQHSIAALAAGCHVLCEKPLAITVNSGEEMVRAANQSGRKLFVVKQNRFNAPVMATKKLLDEGRLGRISGFQVNCFWNRPDAYYANSWHGTKHMDGGVLFTQFSHFIDLIYWFLGEIDGVSGWRGNFMHQGSIDFEDSGAAAITMKTGAIGTLQYTINTHASNMEGSFTLFGDKGTVKIGGQYLNRMEHFSVENETPPRDEPSTANQYGNYQGSMSNHHMVYHELIRALDDSGHRIVEAAEALRSVAMIERIYAASPFVQTMLPS